MKRPESCCSETQTQGSGVRRRGTKQFDWPVSIAAPKWTRFVAPEAAASSARGIRYACAMTRTRVIGCAQTPESPVPGRSPRRPAGADKVAEALGRAGRQGRHDLGGASGPLQRWAIAAGSSGGKTVVPQKDLHAEERVYTPRFGAAASPAPPAWQHGLGRPCGQKSWRGASSCATRRLRYRQSVLGYVWVIIPPLTTSLIFILLNSANVLVEQGPRDVVSGLRPHGHRLLRALL